MKLLMSFILFLFSFVVFSTPAYASIPLPQPTQRYFQAEVIQVLGNDEKDIAGRRNFVQKLEAVILHGEDKGKKVTLEQGGIFFVTPQQLLKKGDQIVLIKTITSNNKTIYSILDRYRLDRVLFIALAFFLLVIFIAGKKGIGSIIGMGISLGVILFFIVPNILKGSDPLLISISGSLMIMVTTIYLAHGFSKKVSVAVISTFISLVITGILSFIAVKLTHLSGLGNENTYLLQFGETHINLQGLLLGGMIIGALGVLDDVTTTQSAAVFELFKTNPKTSAYNLLEKGFNVGREHITSLVNTLVLAYAGASLGLFILFVLNPAKQPYWVILNSEIITEEIIRTLSGSAGLVLAVPITTLLSVFICKHKSSSSV